MVAALFWPRAKEPVYQGKELSQWVQESINNFGEELTYQQEAVAIQQIGTNALPWLVRWISYEPRAWRDRAEGVANRLPGRDTVLRWLRKGDDLAPGAAWGFKILGPRASPAVPDLIRLINDPHRGVSAERAMIALSEIGKAGFSPLLKVLESRQERRFKARYCILKMYDSGMDIGPAMPAILLQDHEIRALHRVDWFQAPVSYWPGLAERPEKFVCSLTDCLHHPKDEVRLEAACALGELGVKASSARDALTVALSDSAVSVREAATNALREVSSERLGQRGGQ
jgi:hypothetical protein